MGVGLIQVHLDQPKKYVAKIIVNGKDEIIGSLINYEKKKSISNWWIFMGEHDKF
jgi:hypothetical protein